MKTIGERIQQARLKRGWSAEYLAKHTGYKTQSGISNLENKATGSGGNKIKDIARVLRVSVDWLMNGPDSPNVPFLEPISSAGGIENGTRVAEHTATGLYEVKTTPNWPFTLFDESSWLALPQKDREEFENLIAGAVMRAQKTRASF